MAYVNRINVTSVIFLESSRVYFQILDVWTVSFWSLRVVGIIMRRIIARMKTNLALSSGQERRTP